VGYKLPDRHNRGKPLDRYSLDTRGKRSKYPNGNYVLMRELSKPLKAFLPNVSSIYLLSGMQKALEDPKWV